MKGSEAETLCFLFSCRKIKKETGGTMQKFTNMPELLTYLLQAKHPDEIESQAVLAMHTVEECNKGGAKATLVISPIQVCDEQEKELGISGEYPEVDEQIQTGEQLWQKRIFVFSDDGTGVVLFERLSPSK